MSKPRILVIDDEIGICEGVKRALSPEGMIVDLAFDGEEGLKQIRENDYQVVLLDVMMPGISGIELIGMIHDHDPNIVCITITGFATVELAVKAIKAGAYDFLTKPFSVDDLLLAVNHGIERRHLALEAERAHEIEQEAIRLEEERNRLQELDRAKAELIRLFTHELKAPVAAIQYYLELMQDGYIKPDQQTDIIQKCLARTQEEMNIIADLLELGKMQVLDDSLRATPINMDEILRSVIDEYHEQINEKKLRLSLNIGDNLPKIYGIAERFKSMWENLLSNAIKYTPQNGEILINILVDESGLICEIQDSGIGIPVEEQSRLFTEFFRAKNAKSSNIQGTGLGLVIVKKVVENVGGHITVNSIPNMGTTFRINIPIPQCDENG